MRRTEKLILVFSLRTVKYYCQGIFGNKKICILSGMVSFSSEQASALPQRAYGVTNEVKSRLKMSNFSGLLIQYKEKQQE